MKRKSKFHSGSYFEQRADGHVYIGEVIDVNPSAPDRIRVRWHKNYSTWEDGCSGRKVRRPNP